MNPGRRPLTSSPWSRVWRAVSVVTGASLLGLSVLAGPGLLAATMVVEGVVLVVAGALGWRATLIPPGERLLADGTSPDDERVGRPTALVALGAITTLALVIRLVGLDTDLWLDEIVTVRDYATLPATDIMRTYGAANNHLLNSLLVHLSIGALGYREWAIRLPAMVAGLLTVPATYWVARRAQPRLPALVGAGVVAVAYQHVFFSQNARGYAAYMLFAVLASGLLIDGLRTDRPGRWVAYVACAALCVASVPTGAFVVAGHAAIAAVLLGVAVARGRRPWHALRRLLGVFGATCLLVLQVYSYVVGSAVGVATGAWQSAEAGFPPLSRAFLAEIGRAAGFGSSPATSALALLAVAALAVGLVSLARRSAALLLALSLGPPLHLLYAAARGLAFSPRFLVLLLVPVVLVATETIDVAARLGRRRRAWLPGVAYAVGALLLAGAVASPFRYFLGVPKQRFRTAIALAEARRGDGMVVAVYTADAPLRYYAVEHPVGAALREGVTFAVARTARQLDDLAAAAGGPLILVSTFERGLQEGRPELDRRVRARWRRIGRFPGAIDDGAVSVWVPRG